MEHNARPPMPSWVDLEDADSITEITDVLDKPALQPMPVVRDRPVLVRLDGERAGEVHALVAPTMSLGRSPTNQVQLDDPGVSRCHARWGVSEGHFFVEDLGSANGTFVAGQRQPRFQLESNDILQLGPRVMLRFSLVDKHEEGLMRELYRSSRIDTLTRVYNRKYLDDRLRSEFAFSQRHRQNLALILFDVDHFKNVNDRYGHAGGDAVLRQVARCCQDRLRAEDLLARVGGEEFAVLLRGVGLRGAVQLAERLRSAVEAQVTEHLGQPIQVTMSAGCATDRALRGATPASLFEAADVCLYRAKRSGRNRVASPLDA